MRTLPLLPALFVLLLTGPGIFGQSSPLDFGPEIALTPARFVPSTSVWNLRSASDGDTFLTIWSESGGLDDSAGALKAARLTREGEVLDIPALEIGLVAGAFDAAGGEDGFVVAVPRISTAAYAIDGIDLTRLDDRDPYVSNNVFVPVLTGIGAPIRIRRTEEGFLLGVFVGSDVLRLFLLDEALQVTDSFDLQGMTRGAIFAVDGDELQVIESSGAESYIRHFPDFRRDRRFSRYTLPFHATEVIAAADDFILSGTTVTSPFESSLVFTTVSGDQAGPIHVVAGPLDGGIEGHRVAAADVEIVFGWEQRSNEPGQNVLFAARVAFDGTVIEVAEVTPELSPYRAINLRKFDVIGGYDRTALVWNEGAVTVDAAHAVAALISAELPLRLIADRRILVTYRTSGQIYPDICPLQTGAFVVWREEALSPDFRMRQEIRGAFISPDGELLKALTISSPAHGNFALNPRCATRPGGVLVSWQQGPIDGPFKSFGADVRADGSPGDPFPIFDEESLVDDLSCAADGTCLAVLLTKRLSTEPDNPAEIYAVRIGADHSVGEPALVRIPRSGRLGSPVRVATDGRRFLMAWLEWTGPAYYVVRATVDASANDLAIDVHDILATTQRMQNVTVTWEGDRYLVLTTRGDSIVKTELSPDGDSLDGDLSGWEGLAIAEAGGLEIASTATAGPLRLVSLSDGNSDRLMMLDRQARAFPPLDLGGRAVVAARPGGGFYAVYYRWIGGGALLPRLFLRVSGAPRGRPVVGAR